MAPEMKLKLEGLSKEKYKSGTVVYRVRVIGDVNKKITLPVFPDHPEFIEMYHAARRGIKIDPKKPKHETCVRDSVSWLTYLYEEYLDKEVEAGIKSPKTAKKKKQNLAMLRKECGEYEKQIPRKELIRMRDARMTTPAAADYLTETVRVMYKWALEKEHVDHNPAMDIKRIDECKGGAAAWSIDDVRQFLSFHKAGTSARKCLLVLLFTACRIQDAHIMGPRHIIKEGGKSYIDFQPQKKGSPKVRVPVSSQFVKEMKKGKILGGAFVLSKKKKPYASADSLSQTFVKWCKQAGLNNHSAHGVRKGVGKLLAEEGATQYQIMSIHGHTSPKTSEIYTKEAQRKLMAEEAAKSLVKIKL